MSDEALNVLVVAALKAARAVIADREYWTQCFDALDQDGHSVMSNDPAAYCFCLNGAITRGLLPNGGPVDHEVARVRDAAQAELNRAARLMFGASNFTDVNDGNCGLPDDCEDEAAVAHANVLKLLEACGA